MRLIIQNSGGLLFEPVFGDVGKNIELTKNMPIFDNTADNVFDVNPRSKAIERNEQVLQKSIGNIGPLRTKVCGPHSGYSTMHPLFAHVMEQCKQQINFEAVKDRLHSVLGVILKQNNDPNFDEDKQKDEQPLESQPNLFCEHDSGVRSISKELTPGSIFTTPALDTRHEHKRHAPRGSPSRNKRHPKRRRCTVRLIN